MTIIYLKKKEIVISSKKRKRKKKQQCTNCRKLEVVGTWQLSNRSNSD